MRKIIDWLKKNSSTVGVVLSVFFLYLTFRKISWGDLKTCFSAASIHLIALVILLNFIIRLVLVFRWQKLLAADLTLGFSSVYHYMNIGYFVNSILPARIGDLVKALLVSGRFRVNKTNAIASIGYERLLDMMGLGTVFLVALFVLKIPPYIRNGGFIILLIVTMITLMIFIFHKSFDPKIREENTGRLNFYRNWLWDKFRKFRSYTKNLNTIHSLVNLFLSTAVIWFLYIYIGYLIVEEINPGPWSWQISILSLLIVSVSFILPSTPGNLGLYQFACVLAFELAGLDKEPAIVYSIISQIPVFLMSIGLGFHSISVEGFSLKSLKLRTERVADEH